MGDKFNPDVVKHLAMVLKEHDLTHLKYQIGDCVIDLKRSHRETRYHRSAMYDDHDRPNIKQVVECTNDQADDYAGAILSRMVGVVYLSPAPGERQFINVGDDVKAGQTIMVIMSMKVMNPIKADTDGKVLKILVDDGDPVEFGTPLLIII